MADAVFIQTIPGRNFLAALRLYGSEDAFYDQTWKSDAVANVRQGARHATALKTAQDRAERGADEWDGVHR